MLLPLAIAAALLAQALAASAPPAHAAANSAPAATPEPSLSRSPTSSASPEHVMAFYDLMFNWDVLQVVPQESANGHTMF
jgi:hypothetical protein